MKSRVESTRGVLAHCDFSRARSVVDVGGGLGHLAFALVERYPQLRATVLDVPEVIAAAKRHAANKDTAVPTRLSFEAGDMFVDVPPGDRCLLKAIIHDWDDERDHPRRRRGSRDREDP
jgi:spermidine synthase